MSQRLYGLSTLVVAGLVAAAAGRARAVSMESVTVGNRGNVGDSRYGGYGGVNHTYQMGKYEVTAGQYAEFLNAVAGTDAYGLYNTNMDTAVDAEGCNIRRTGAGTEADPYIYSVSADWADRPVNWVSWGDAGRFANWIHNGQPAGLQNASTTEDGSYYLNGAVTEAALLVVTRKAIATWVLPSEDEWYKAAYHKNDGVTGNYWDFPTRSDGALSNLLGNPTDPGNNATFYSDGYTIGSPYYRTATGAHENSHSPYGTFDQGGNVWEWNETVFADSYRGVRGGSFLFLEDYLRASRRGYDNPAIESSQTGFRIAQVPDPTTILMLALTSMGICRRRTAALATAS